MQKGIAQTVAPLIEQLSVLLRHYAPPPSPFNNLTDCFVIAWEVQYLAHFGLLFAPFSSVPGGAGAKQQLSAWISTLLKPSTHQYDPEIYQNVGSFHQHKGDGSNRKR